MDLHKLLLTNNACYIAGKKLNVKGIMVHSTAANNPYISRYVGPDDGLLGPNKHGNHWNQKEPNGRKICCHAFIGKLKDGDVATYQTLPWEMRGWHGASGKKGSVNDTHIGFEICEDDTESKSYCKATYEEAAELCAMLCDKFSLDPLGAGVIIGHYEGHDLGIASNHGDPRHWWRKHGLSMDSFRARVKELMQGKPEPKPDPEPAPKPIDKRPITELSKPMVVCTGIYRQLPNALVRLQQTIDAVGPTHWADDIHIVTDGELYLISCSASEYSTPKNAEQRYAQVVEALASRTTQFTRSVRTALHIYIA